MFIPGASQTWQNMNKRDELDRVRARALEHLQQLRGAPGLAMRERPPEALLPEAEGQGDEHEEEQARVHLSACCRCSVCVFDAGGGA